MGGCYSSLAIHDVKYLAERIKQDESVNQGENGFQFDLVFVFTVFMLLMFRCALSCVSVST